MSGIKIIPQISPKFKLERNTVIYSRWLAGESSSKLSIYYQLNEKTIRGILKNYKKKVSLGSLPEVKPYED